MGDIDKQLREYNQRVCGALIARHEEILRRSYEDKVRRLWSKSDEQSRVLFCDGVTESDDEMVDKAIKAYLEEDYIVLGGIVTRMVDEYVRLIVEADE